MPGKLGKPRGSEGHKRALWGVALGVGEKPSRGLPSRMLGAYKTGERLSFPGRFNFFLGFILPRRPSYLRSSYLTRRFGSAVRLGDSVVGFRVTELI
jgi:hypothetical protein